MKPMAIGLKPQLSWRKLDRRIVVLDPAGGNHYLFNELGGKVWMGMVQGRPMEHTIRAIMREYAVSRDRAERDVEAFLAGLEAERIIVREKEGE